LWSGFVDRKGTATKVLAVHLLNRSCASLVIRELNKAKAFAAPCLTVLDNVDRCDFAELAECVSNLVLSNCVGQIAYI
jgi:hypothetical protein